MKKFVVLLLVLAMVFAFAATASATDFTDDSAITYKDAVEVLTALGVIDGFPDGSFDPDGNVTREQAAKIIAYLLLGEKAADRLVAESAPFTDVAANRWSAGYIAFCVREGILDGYGDGKFGPQDQVTGYQFAKMLLCAIGYGADGEFVGAGWTTNVAKFAIPLDIFKGNEDGANNSPANREEAVLYAFNTLFVNLVKFNAFLGEYLDKPFNGDEEDEYGTLAGTVFDMLDKTGIVVANGATDLSNAATEDDEAVTEIYVAADAEEEGFDGVYEFVLDTGLSMIGHKVKVFYYEDEDTGDDVAYIAIDKATLVAGIRTNAEKLDSKAVAAGFKKGTAADAILIENYQKDDFFGTTDTFDSDKEKRMTLISNDKKKAVDYIICADMSFDKVTKITTKDDVTTYAFFGGSKLDTAAGSGANDVTVTGEVAKDDYVVITTVGVNIYNIAVAADIEGTVEAYNSYNYNGSSNQTLTIDGTAYYVSDITLDGNNNSDLDDVEASSKMIDVEAKFYLDPYNELIAFDGDIIATNYAYIPAFGTKEDELGYYKESDLTALVYFADGTHGIYTVDKKKSDSVIFHPGLYNVTVLASGKIAVKLIQTPVSYSDPPEPIDLKITKGVSKAIYEVGEDSYVYYTNADTVAFYVTGHYLDDDLEVAVLKGTANILTTGNDLSDDSDIDTLEAYYKAGTKNVLTALLFAGDSATSTQDLVYYNGKYSEVVTGDKTVVTYTVYKDGEETTVAYDKYEGDGPVTKVGFYKVGAYDLTEFDLYITNEDGEVTFSLNGAKAEASASVDELYAGTLTFTGWKEGVLTAQVSSSTPIVDLTKNEVYTKEVNGLGDADYNLTIAINWSKNDTTGVLTATAIYVLKAEAVSEV